MNNGILFLYRKIYRNFTKILQIYRKIEKNIPIKSSLNKLKILSINWQSQSLNANQ